MAMGLTRLTLAICLICVSVTSAATETEAFDRAWLEAEAKRLAGRDFEAPEDRLPERLAEIDYETYRAIRFRPEASLLGRESSRFSVDLLPPGHRYRFPVEISIVKDGQATPVAFDVSRFDFGELESVARAAQGLFHSGFRIRYPLNRPDVQDEVVVFQGASYFRAVDRGHRYGLSARGLSVKTADPTGEEFPRFNRFWIEQPGASDSRLRIHALLDSPSVAGAYTFVIIPGEATTIDVEALLYPRVRLEQVGIAAQTAMFLFDESNRGGFDDYRTGVHDADGLKMITGTGMRLWRPLANPRKVEVSAFVDRDPTGFGLVQRDRRFTDFEDDNALYHKRPSAWVEPLGKWGEGAVVLVEIPTDSEFNDNIVTHWQPATPLEAGSGYRYRYRIHWSELPGDETPLARVVGTRIGAGPEPGSRHIVVDFDGGERGVEPLPKVEASAGRIANVTLRPIEGTEWRRVSFDLDPQGKKLVELGIVLQTPAGDWSEKWVYRWTPRP